MLCKFPCKNTLLYGHILTKKRAKKSDEYVMNIYKISEIYKHENSKDVA